MRPDTDFAQREFCKAWATMATGFRDSSLVQFAVCSEGWSQLPAHLRACGCSLVEGHVVT